MEKKGQEEEIVLTLSSHEFHFTLLPSQISREVWLNRKYEEHTGQSEKGKTLTVPFSQDKMCN